MMTIFSLFVTFTGTFAWFLGNRYVEGASEDFAVNKIDGRLESITFHRLREDGVTKGIINGVPTPTQFSFEQNYVGIINYSWNSFTQEIEYTSQGDTNISLNQYTPLDQEQPLLLMLNLKDEYSLTENSLTISAHTDVERYLGERNNFQPVCRLDGNVYTADTNANPMIRKVVSSKPYFPLSSVVKFSYLEMCATGNEYEGQKSIDDITNGSTSYDFNLTNDDKELFDSSNQFVTVYDDEDDDTLFSQNINIYSSSQAKVKHIALVIDYFPDAVEYLYSTFLGNDVLDGTLNGVLNFICDWSMGIV